MIAEYCEVWRYFARSIRSLLRISAAFYSGHSPEAGDWKTIGDCPEEVWLSGLLESQIIEDVKEKAHARGDHEFDEPGSGTEPDILSPSWPTAGEGYWTLLTHGAWNKVQLGYPLWVEFLNSLLDIGRVRPWVILDGAAHRERPRMVFAGPNLLSYLALQVCLRASKLDAFVVCSYCNKEYMPKRAPKAGQRNYCVDCRNSGVPIRIAQRDRRMRAREQKE